MLARYFRLCGAIFLLFFVLFPAGCWKEGRLSPRIDDPAKVEKVRVAVYYPKIMQTDAFLVREVHEVPSGHAPYRTALQELISGPPQTEGATRVLPKDTEILNITVENGLATVDFSEEVLKANTGAIGELLGIQSVVNTLTEFPEIKQVSFLVNGRLDNRVKDWWGHVGLYGQPFKRNLSRVYEPAIWVIVPTPDSVVSSPLRVVGSARVFEGTVRGRLVGDNGRKLAEGFTTATAGAPARGDFELILIFKPPADGRGRLEVFWESPEDGREVDKVVVPVRFK